MKNKVIKLADGIEYLIIDEMGYMDRVFAFGFRVNNETGEIFEKEPIVVEEKIVDGKIMIDKIQDSEFEIKVTNTFIEQMNAN